MENNLDKLEKGIGRQEQCSGRNCILNSFMKHFGRVLMNYY